MPEIKENSPKVVPLTFNDMIWLQLQEMGKRFDQIDKRMDQLDKRMDKIENRMDKIENKIEKLDEKIENVRQEINSNINELRKDIQTSSNHGNIMTASVVSIALGVLYSIFSK